MKNALTRLKELWSDERGQALGEYTFIIMLVALVCVVGLGLLANALLVPFSEVASGIGGGS